MNSYLKRFELMHADGFLHCDNVILKSKTMGKTHTLSILMFYPTQLFVWC